MISKNELAVSLKYVSQFPTVVDEILADYVAFIDSSKSFCAEREKIRREYSIDEFNIFTSIADKYRKELFHSDILKLILDPNTPEIGDIQYLTEFARLLRTENKNITVHDFPITVKVERERGKIDVFISDDTHCIIIENKLNDAVDQPNQLARYLQVAKVKGKEVYAVVYIPLSSKEPPLDDYSDEYKTNVGEIKEKLVVLPAVELAEKYLDKCAMNSKNETARVYIKQYANLIKDLGGKSMTTDLDKEFIKKIFSNRESIVAAKNIAAVWKRKAELLGELLRKAIKDELDLDDCKDLYLDDYDNEAILGKSTGDISRVFWFEQENICVGFIANNNKFNKRTQTNLENILNEPKQLKKHFGDVEQTVEQNKCEIFQYFNIDDFDGTVDEMKQILVEKYNSLGKLGTEAANG